MKQKLNEGNENKKVQETTTEHVDDSIFTVVKKYIKDNNIKYSGRNYDYFPEDISKPDVMKMYNLYDLLRYKKEISRILLFNDLKFLPFEINYLEHEGYFNDIELTILPGEDK